MGQCQLKAKSGYNVGPEEGVLQERLDYLDDGHYMFLYIRNIVNITTQTISISSKVWNLCIIWMLKEETKKSFLLTLQMEPLAALKASAHPQSCMNVLHILYCLKVLIIMSYIFIKPWQSACGAAPWLAGWS